MIVTHAPRRRDLGLGYSICCNWPKTAKPAPDVCIVIVCGYCGRES